MLVSKGFIKMLWVVIVTTFLVIVAGSVVRTTQSGMGCPDWPTCFGSTIPPTDSTQVYYQPNHLYKKGQFIIYNDSLKYALQKFTSKEKFNPSEWKQYEKHNNAHFSVLHTWIEFINRLLGVLLGLFVLAVFIWSFWYIKKQPSLVFLSFGLILLTGFQAWLGKTVVDSNLALIKITTHMFGALAMVFLGLYLLYIAKGKPAITTTKRIINLNSLLGLMLVLQLIMGTEVRGQIDYITEHLATIDRSGWAVLLKGWFYVHRSFSLVIAAISIYLFVLSFKQTASLVSNCFKPILGIIIIEIGVGVTLVYFNFPQAAQPLHLLLSSALVALIFNNLLKLKCVK